MNYRLKDQVGTSATLNSGGGAPPPGGGTPVATGLTLITPPISTQCNITDTTVTGLVGDKVFINMAFVPNFSSLGVDTLKIYSGFRTGGTFYGLCLILTAEGYGETPSVYVWAVKAGTAGNLATVVHPMIRVISGDLVNVSLYWDFSLLANAGNGSFSINGAMKSTKQYLRP